MRRVEKSARGMDLDGDVLRRDVAQRVIDFADQQLIAPAPTENEARGNLLWYLFDRYMDHVAQGLDRLRDERQRLSRGKAFAVARLHGVSDEQRVARQQELASVLEDLSEASTTLDLEHVGEVFEVVLSHPEDCLSSSRSASVSMRWASSMRMPLTLAWSRWISSTCMSVIGKHATWFWSIARKSI